LSLHHSTVFDSLFLSNIAVHSVGKHYTVLSLLWLTVHAILCYCALFLPLHQQQLCKQEPADEYCIGHVKDFEGKKLSSIDKEGVKLGDEDEKSLKSLEKHYKQEYTPLTDYLKGLYKNKVCVLLFGLLVAASSSTGTATRATLLITVCRGHDSNHNKCIRSRVHVITCALTINCC
jgi:Hsp90 protein